MEIKKEWLNEGINHQVVEQLKNFAQTLTRRNQQNQRGPLTTSQLRRFFSELRRIEANYDANVNRVSLLRAFLAYAVGRDDRNTQIRDFEEKLSPLIAAIDLNDTEMGKKQFKNLVKIVEVIVAYHKYYGGK